MSWVRSAKVAAALLGASALVPGAASAAIVVASSGPSASQFPPGKKLDDTARISLQAGDSVTVLDQRGTKVLKGPVQRVSVSQPGRPLPNPAFAVLTRNQAASRARTGAVRTGDDGKPVSPNLWYVDFAQPGTKCITDPAAVRFWRADPAKAARYRVTAPAGAPAMFSFAAGADTASWDASKAPIAEGATYALARDGSSDIGKVTFAIIANPPSDAEALALALIAKGCSAQVDLLSKTLAISRF